MKRLKSIFLCLALVLSTCLMGGANMVAPKSKYASADILPNTVFNYISLSQNGQQLNSSNFRNVDNTTYIVANDSLTINFRPFEFLYSNLNITSLFYPLTQNIDVVINSSTRSEFEYNGSTYYLDVISNVANFYRTPVGGTSFMTTENNNLLSIASQNGSTVTIQVIKSLTWKDDSISTSLSFDVRNSIYSPTNSYTLNLNRPVINFGNASNPAFLFETTSFNHEDSSDSLLVSEEEYTTVKMNFLSNNYSEVNPLMYNINYNGFTYNFELYYKTIQSRECLFVNYIDSAKAANNRYLATRLDESGNITFEVPKTNNDFYMLFDKTGRYEIEIYDQTYLSHMKNSNYYKTSFYIKSKNVSAFENIYMIAQTYDASGNVLNYIVDDSTQNNSVQISVKNLTNLTDQEGNPLELRNVIDKIEILKTVYGASDNEHVSTNYSISQILQMISKDTGDLLLQFEDDADYDIIIYDKNSNAEITYSFTIAKKAKTHYTPSGESEHKANILYHTEILNYTYNIDSNLPITYGYGSGDPISASLNKNYVNHYSISYGMEEVAIEQIEDTGTDENNKEKAKKDLILRFMGVGDITVTVTVDGVTTTYNLNYEQGNSTLTFTEYGKYTVSMVDSMGTSTSTFINYKQPTNVSTIILIVLSAVIVAVVLFFVLRARGKVKTR